MLHDNFTIVPLDVNSAVHIDNGLVIILDYLILGYLLPFFLTKYSAILAEVKRYFGIIEIVC